MTVRTDDVLAYRLDGELVCADCATEAEDADAAADDIVIRDEVGRDDDLWFCDRCKQRIR